jgi:ribosomal protein S18 acetylase RimI-like enzyme
MFRVRSVPAGDSAVSTRRSGPALAEAAGANFVVHAGWLQRRLPGMRVTDGEIVAIDSGLPCDTFNVVCAARLDGSGRESRIRAVIEHFGSAGRPFSWWVGPGDRPSDLPDLLVAAGLKESETELAMAADLDALPSGVAAPAGLRVERVGTARGVADFARVQAANWSPPDPEVLRFYELGSASLLSEDCPMHPYVGYLGQEPVAASELTLGGGVAGLYNVATREAYRRRGFGSALTLLPLLDANQRGYRTAVLQAAAEGVRIYERMGFQTFGHITEFKPPA